MGSPQDNEHKITVAERSCLAVVQAILYGLLAGFRARLHSMDPSSTEYYELNGMIMDTERASALLPGLEGRGTE